MSQVERFPMGIPSGWFCVGYGDELDPGEIRSVHYFGRDLVVFRNEEGEAGLLDAYCPHLGAHLGHGGTIVGNSIRCPFHGWEFATNGFCTKIPYGKIFPPRLKREPLAQAYPVVERNGVIWAWYHPHGEKPHYEVMVHPEFTDDGWAKAVRREWRFASNPQEIAENGVDFAHFEFVHKMDSVPEGVAVYEEHIRRSEAHGQRQITLDDGTTKKINSSVSVVQNGAGQKFTRIKGVVELSMMVLATPIDKDDVELRFAFTHPPVDTGSAQEKAVQQAIANTCGQTGVEGDIPIWHNKIHRANPFLCDGDGPILRLRRYFEQFYVDDEKPVIAAE